MDIIKPDIWTIVFGGFTAISCIIAIYQTISMVKIKTVNTKLERANEELKKANEQKCSRRCKDIAEIVEHLAENMSTACRVVRNICINKNQPCTYLVAKVDNSVNLTRSLIHFCERLNKEHFEEFGRYVDIDFSNMMQFKECLVLEEENLRKVM